MGVLCGDDGKAKMENVASENNGQNGTNSSDWKTHHWKTLEEKKLRYAKRTKPKKQPSQVCCVARFVMPVFVAE